MKKNKKVEYKDFIQKENNFLKNENKIKKNSLRIIKNIKLNLNNEKNVFHTLSKDFLFNFRIKDLKHFRKYKNVIIIGMGGSILGSQAIYSFLEKKIKKKFIFVDTIDIEKLQEIKKKTNFSKTLFILISKSGYTIETLTNISFLNILNKSKKNLIVISDKKSSPLYLITKKLNLFYVEHKKYIGGRYSVLSEVGVLPAYLMGINIKKLRLNIRKYLTSKNLKSFNSSLIKIFNILNNKKFKSLILLNYIPELNNFLFWSQQLIAESLGKNGKGLLPVVSPSPKDHHSLLQLYLDGPKDKIFYIFSLRDTKKVKVNSPLLVGTMNFLNNKNIQHIKNSQKNALLSSLKKNKIPFREFIIPEINEAVIGELFSFFILETAILGKLLGINPFSQPAVEQVKTDTKKILS